MDKKTYHSGHGLGNEHWIIRLDSRGDYVLPAASVRDEHRNVSLLRIDDQGNVLHAANPTPKTEPEKFACMFFGIVSRDSWENRPNQ